MTEWAPILSPQAEELGPCSVGNGCPLGAALKRALGMPRVSPRDRKVPWFPAWHCGHPLDAYLKLPEEGSSSATALGIEGLNEQCHSRET